MLLCIQTGSTLDDPNRFRFGTKEFYFKSPEEMAELFADVPEALENTLEIAERCNCEFDFGRSKLPDPGVPEGVAPGDHMIDRGVERPQAPAGRRAARGVQSSSSNTSARSSTTAASRRICSSSATSPISRGARASTSASEARPPACLVGYGLGITDVDPIEYGLAFERFLNPERVEMPDVDLDIQDDRRDELIQYVCEKYGRDRVGQIATFGSLKARAAVRDCGRVLGMDLAEVDRVCKMIPTLPVGHHHRPGDRGKPRPQERLQGQPRHQER